VSSRRRSRSPPRRSQATPRRSSPHRHWSPPRPSHYRPRSPQALAHRYVSPSPPSYPRGPLTLSPPRVTGSVVYVDGNTGAFQTAAVVHLPATLPPLRHAAVSPPPPSRRQQRRIDRSTYFRELNRR
jgi:hypothetical protein